MWLNKSSKWFWIIPLCFSFFTLKAEAFQKPKMPPIEVASITISRNCTEAFDPTKRLESTKVEACPRSGENQLIQVVVRNYTQKAKDVGIQVVIYRNQQRLKTSLPRLKRKISPVDDVRVLYDYTIPPEGGRYRVSVNLFDKRFKRLIGQSHEGVEREFYIITDAEIARLQEEEKAEIEAIEKEKEQKLAKLEFEPIDLQWEQVRILPKHVLRGEKFQVRLDLVNTGGDIARNIEAEVNYYNVRLPRRRNTIAKPSIEILAPGETATFELEYSLPDDQLLGEYQIVAVIDPEKKLKEQERENNERTSNTMQLSDIKLLLPPEQFEFERTGLFFFQWDSLQYREFKLQIGTEKSFEDPTTYFDLPQGDRWIADKELVPLAGELPAMAEGLMKNFNKTFLYWRVVGRKADGKQSFSNVRTFSIKAKASES